jgi:hypothetical protein
VGGAGELVVSAGRRVVEVGDGRQVALRIRAWRVGRTISPALAQG